MKWFVFVPATASFLLLGFWLKRNPNRLGPLLTIIPLLAFVQPSISRFKLALIGQPDFLGYVHGLEVTLLDLVALTLLIALPPARGVSSFGVVRAFYLVAVLVSSLQAATPIPAFFVAWQLLRMYLVFSVVVRACQHPEGPPLILRGICWGVMGAGVLAIMQRFITGLHEATAFFDHQNLIGLACYFGMMPAFAITLSQRSGWLAPGTLLAGAAAIFLSLSRGGLVLTGVGLLLVLVLSMTRHFRLRKAVIASTALAIGVLFVGVSYERIAERFATRSYGGFDANGHADERVRLERAASMMLQEHPMGVGANHFALVLHTQGYFHKAKLEYHKGSRGIFVHNLYRLTAAECGYLGLAALLALLARVLSFAFWHGWRTRQDVRADVLVGFSVSFLVFCFHGLIEWVHVTASIQYLFWVSAGVVAGLAHQLKHRADSSS